MLNWLKILTTVVQIRTTIFGTDLESSASALHLFVTMKMTRGSFLPRNVLYDFVQYTNNT